MITIEKLSKILNPSYESFKDNLEYYDCSPDEIESILSSENKRYLFPSFHDFLLSHLYGGVLKIRIINAMIQRGEIDEIIKSNVVIEKSTFQGKFEILPKLQIKNMTIENCHFLSEVSFSNVGDLKIVNCAFDKEVLFYGGIKDLKFHEENAELGKINVFKFSHCNLTQIILNVKTTTSLNFLDCISDCISLRGTFEIISFMRTRFPTIILQNFHCARTIEFDSFTNEQLNISFLDNVTIREGISFSPLLNTFNVNIFENGEELKYIERIKINGLKGDLYFKNSNNVLIDNFIIDQCEIKSGSFIDIINLGCTNLIFNNLKNSGKVYLRHCFFNARNRSANGNIFSILESDLGKADFINCNFQGGILNIDKSKIIDLFLAGSEMPSEIKLKDNDYKTQRLGYAQLKKVYENCGDRLNANLVFSKEMDSHRIELIKEGKRKNFADLFTLTANKISSNHGKSWVQAGIFTILITFIFFTWLCYTLGYRITFSVMSKNYLADLSGHFLVFLNPLHKNDFLDDIYTNPKNVPRWTSWTVFVDSLSRLLITYGIYQFVQAFRKYSKGSGN